MDQSALYQRRAQECATLRDLAKSELGRARLDRECADWMDLARDAGRSASVFSEIVRLDRSWRPRGGQTEWATRQ